jgi:hypothetical protein
VIYITSLFERMSMPKIKYASFIVFSLTLLFFLTTTSAVDAQKRQAKQARKIYYTATITADKIRNDIIGKTVYRIPSEETVDGLTDWQFSYDQPREIQILQKNTYSDEAVVDARVSARKRAVNFDGTYDRVAGVARLYYERAEGRWVLRSIDNISLRHDGSYVSDNGSNWGNDGDSNLGPRTGGNYPLPSGPTGGVTSIVSDRSVLSIPAGNYRSFTFQVANLAVVTGRFQARGGTQNDIEAYILDRDGFMNWANDHRAPAYYNSGRLTVGNIKTTLGPGTYYLVFNNRASQANDRTVEANIELRTDAAALPPVGVTGVSREYNYPYNGTGAGTVNVLHRNYLPTAAPVLPNGPGGLTPDRVFNVTETAVKPRVADDTGVFAVGGYSSEQLLSNRFEVRNRREQAFPFVVKAGGAIRGTFSVVGFDERNIEAYIMTSAEYDKWSHYREAITNYSSGRVTNGRIARNLKPGNYYLVFSNHYSGRESKTIEANVVLEYEPK